MTINTKQIKELLDNPETREKGLLALAEWAKNMCLYFGASASTAYSVAAAVARGLEAEYQRLDRQ